MAVDRPRDGERLARYRDGYLKLQSVLNDRTVGLPAVPLLTDTLRRTLEHARRIAVLHVAIENASQVESLYGWQVFDRLREAFAARLKTARGAEIPSTAILAVAAVGSPSYVIFVPPPEGGGDFDRYEIESWCDAVSTALESLLGEDRFAGLGPRLSVRTGHAFLSLDPFYRFERRLRAAVEESARYENDRRRRRERSWDGELRKILRERSVRALFQPVVELATGKVVGHEALTRGPEDSPLEMPGTLFAVSARMGVACEMDRLCRENALQTALSCGSLGKLFLNLVPASVEEPGVAAELDALSGWPAGDLVLELSERDLDDDPDRWAECFERLRAAGFAVGVDDVGTGFASRALLERVRPDFLKADISLVRGVDRSPIKQELVQSLVRIARRCGAEVVAEGIESAAEVAALIEAGAGLGQGFWFASPSPSGHSGFSGAAPGRDPSY